MSLLVTELSVWEIAHRWAGYDPSRWRIRLPLEVRDNFRILMKALLHGEMESFTLQLRKWAPADGQGMQKFFIRYYMDDVYACIWGQKFNRTMLKQASIDRSEMMEWCELHSVPLPEFWFPPGWGEGYDWKRRDQVFDEEVSASPDGEETTIRHSTMTKIACQQIARNIWRQESEMTIADMVKHPAIQQLGGAAVYASETVRDWLSAVAPAVVKNKRGRPKKKMGSEPLGDETEVES